MTRQSFLQYKVSKKKKSMKAARFQRDGSIIEQRVFYGALKGDKSGLYYQNKTTEQQAKVTPGQETCSKRKNKGNYIRGRATGGWKL